MQVASDEDTHIILFDTNKPTDPKTGLPPVKGYVHRKKHSTGSDSTTTALIEHKDLNVKTDTKSSVKEKKTENKEEKKQEKPIMYNIIKWLFITLFFILLAAGSVIYYKVKNKKK